MPYSVPCMVHHEDPPVQAERQFPAQGGSYLAGLSLCQYQQCGYVLLPETGQNQNDHVGFIIDDAVFGTHKVPVLFEVLKKHLTD